MMKLDLRIESLVICLVLLIGASVPTASSDEPAESPRIKNWSLSPDDQYLVIIYWNPIVEILDLQTREVRPLISVEGLSQVVWSPDGRYLAAFDCHSGKMVVIDVVQDHIIFESGDLDSHWSCYTSVSWSPDSTQLAVAYEWGSGSSAPASFGVWDATTGEQLHDSAEIEAYAIDWNPSVPLVVATKHPYQEFVYLVDPNMATIVETIDIEFVFEAKWNRDGTLLAMLRVPNIMSNFNKYELLIWDVASKTVVNSYSLDFPSYFLEDFAWSPVNNQMVILRDLGSEAAAELLLWDWQDTNETVMLSDELNSPHIAWTADGSQIVYLDTNGQLNFIGVE